MGRGPECLQSGGIALLTLGSSLNVSERRYKIPQDLCWYHDCIPVTGNILGNLDNFASRILFQVKVEGFTLR